MKEILATREIKEVIGARIGNTICSFIEKGEEEGIDRIQQMLNEYADEYNSSHAKKIEIVFNYNIKNKKVIEGKIIVLGEGAEEFKKLYNL